jgi:hypothetical protein
MHEEHRWTIKDLLRHMVTEESEEKYYATPAKRAKDIATAVFDQPEVLTTIQRAREYTTHFLVAGITDVIKKELWRLHQDPLLGTFNIDTTPKDLDIPGIANRIEEVSPVLWEFLKMFTQSPHPGDQERQGHKSLRGTLILISASLAHLYTPRRCNGFQSSLGIHLHSMGVKRATLDLLAGLGIIPRYATIINYSTDLAGKGMVSGLSTSHLIQPTRIVF